MGLGVFAILTAAAGVGLRNLQTWARFAGTFFLGLWGVGRAVRVLTGDATNQAGAGFTFLLSLGLLIALWHPRAATVFTDHYRSTVIPNTPNISEGRFYLWVAITLVLLFILAFVGAILYGLEQG